MTGKRRLATIGISYGGLATADVISFDEQTGVLQTTLVRSKATRYGLTYARRLRAAIRRKHPEIKRAWIALDD